VLDASALGLSALCLIHCLALPLVVALAPMLAAWTGAPWVHGLLISLAAPLSAFALWRKSQRPVVILLALAGLSLMALGAVGWPRLALETPLTVCGSLLLATAHLFNWKRRHAH
jgi:hypothetical protein